MTYTYKTIECPYCGNTTKYQIDIFDNKGDLLIANNYIECGFCSRRFFIGNSTIEIKIIARKLTE